MAFHQNNHSTQRFLIETRIMDDDAIKRLEKDNFNLRRQSEENNKTINVLRENYSKQQKDLDDTKAKNQLLETKSIEQEAEIKRISGLFVNACKKRDPHALNKKLEETNEKLQDTEKELNSVKDKNRHLKRKLSDDRTEYEKHIKKKRQKLTEKCAKLDQCQNDLKIEQEKCTTLTNELASVHKMLETTKEKITELEDKRDSQMNLIKTQNECIRELKSQVSLLQHTLEEKHSLQQSLEKAQKLIHDLEQVIKIRKSKTKKLQSRHYNLKTKLKRKQNELDGNLIERNHLFKFAQDVGILIQFNTNNSSPLQNQLPELFAHLKDMLRVRGCQYRQQNEEHNISSSSLQQPSIEKDEGDHQLHDEFTSSSMLNIGFPLQLSSPRPQPQPSIVTNVNFQTVQVQTMSILPQQSKTDTETAENAGNSQGDSLFDELMSDLNQSVNQTEEITETKKAKTSQPTRATQTVTGITQTKKHVEDVSKRKKGRGQNCEGGAKYFCKCGKMETSLDRLKVHIEQFNQEKKFQCEICDRRFLYVCYLRQHLTRTHFMPHALDNIIMGCRSCGEMFTSRELHRQHLISAHNNSASISPVVVATENETGASSGETEMTTAKAMAISTVTTDPVVQPPQQPNNVSRRVPSVCMDSEDEEVHVQM